MNEMSRTIDIYRLSFLYTITTSVVMVPFILYLCIYSTEIFLPIVGTVTLFLLYIPRIVYMSTIWLKYIPQHTFGIMEMIITTIHILNMLGGIGLYRVFSYYDMIVHILSPIGVGVVLSLVIASIQKMRGYFHIRTVQQWAICITIALLFIWELFEYMGDRVFGTDMFGQIGEQLDTVYDIGLGVVAMILVYLINLFYLEYMIYESKTTECK